MRAWPLAPSCAQPPVPQIGEVGSTPDVDLLAVLVSAVVVFVAGFAYYAVLGDQLAEVSDAAAAGEQPPPRKLAAEFSRGLILAAVIAGLASAAEIDEWPAACCSG